MSEIIEIKVPDIGDFDEIELIEVSVSIGDHIEKEQTLIVLESDKASMEIPSEAAGKIKKILVKVGDQLSQGDVIVEIELNDNVSTEQTKSKTIDAPYEKIKLEVAVETKNDELIEPPPPILSEVIPEASENNRDRSKSDLHATPSVRQMAREMGVDLTLLSAGSGRKGRILKEDVKAFVKRSLSRVPKENMSGSGIPSIPAVDFSKFGEIEEKTLNKIKQLTGQFLTRNWLNLPMVTHHDEADITDMESFRKSLTSEIKVTGLVFIMKALVGALKQYPQFNSSLSPDGSTLIYKKYFHIGIAVETPNGLVVPVIRNVDQKNIFELSKDLSEMSLLAREGKLKPADMQGGCMTISSLGGIGGQSFTPIVNAPEVAILGVTRSQMKPIWNSEEFVPKLMLPLDLTYDHRVIDGADGARFMKKIIELLSDLRQQLL